MAKDQAVRLRNVVKKNMQHNVPGARILTVTSGKGGVGKSSLAVNLGWEMEKRGKRVIIFDADFGLANVEVMFGKAPKHSLLDVISGNLDIEEVITESPYGIRFISGGSGILGLNDLDPLQLHFLIRSIRRLNGLCDILIVDTGAGISHQVVDFVAASPEILIVSTPEPSSISDAYSLVKATLGHPNFVRDDSRLYLVANKVSSKAEGEAVFERISSAASRFLRTGMDFIGMIPEDPALEKAVRRQQLFCKAAPSARAALAFSDLAQVLLEDSFSKKSGASSYFGISGFLNGILHRSKG